MTRSEKHIGILGLGARTTEFYIHKLNKAYHASKGDYHTFPCVLYNIDFNEINPYLPNNYDALIPKLEKSFAKLKKFSINHLLIPNITLHETLDKLDHGFNLIHPIGLTVQYLKEKEVKNICLFGTNYTMTSDYIISKFQEHNIEVNIPSKEHQAEIDTFRKNVYDYQENNENVEAFKKLIKKYSANSNVVIACTELSIVNTTFSKNPKVIDMAMLQIQQALTLSH